jgi:hypothetical protein
MTHHFGEPAEVPARAAALSATARRFTGSYRVNADAFDQQDGYILIGKGMQV